MVLNLHLNAGSSGIGYITLETRALHFLVLRSPTCTKRTTMQALVKINECEVC